MTFDNHQILMLLGVIAGSGFLVSVVANVVKKLFKLKADAVIHTVVVVIAFVASAAQYVMQIKAKLPPEILGISATAIYGISQLVFKYASYGSSFWSNVQSYNANKSAKSSAADNEVAAVNPAAALFDDEHPTNGLIETGKGIPTPATIVNPAATAPAEFQA